MRAVAVLSLFAFTLVTAFVGLSSPADAQSGTAGCGTDLQELGHTPRVELVGNDGPAAATASVDLSQPLTAGTYAVRTVSMDRHWSERRDQPREQFTVTVGSETVGPTTDLPKNADFLGAMTATSSDQNLANVPVDVFPGELLGTVTLAGGESSFTLTHVDGGAGQGSNSISAHQVTFTCVVTGLDLSFAAASRPFNGDGTAALALSITNSGDADQTGVRVRGVLPNGVDRNGIVTAPSGVTSSIGATIRWEGDVAAGETVVVEIPVVTTDDGYAQCVADTGACTLSAEIVGTDDGAPASGQATVALSATADLEVSTSYAPANNDSAQLAGTITVAITNVADEFMNVTADDIVVATDFASSLSIGANSLGATAGEVALDGSTLNWSVGSLAPGDSAAYSVDVSLPGVGSLSVRSQVISSSALDPDSTPNSLAARLGDDDVATVEDDEAAVLATAAAPSTTTTTFTTTSLPTTTTRAPLVVEVETPDVAEPAFKLDLTEDEVIDLTSLDETPEDSADELTEVAGAIELPGDSIPIVDVDQNNRVPLAAVIAALLVALSAAVVLADRQSGSENKSVTVTTEKTRGRK